MPYPESKTTGVSYETGDSKRCRTIDWEDMTMNIIKRFKRTAWFTSPAGLCLLEKGCLKF